MADNPTALYVFSGIGLFNCLVSVASSAIVVTLFFKQLFGKPCMKKIRKWRSQTASVPSRKMSNQGIQMKAIKIDFQEHPEQPPPQKQQKSTFEKYSSSSSSSSSVSQQSISNASGSPSIHGSNSLLKQATTNNRRGSNATLNPDNSRNNGTYNPPPSQKQRPTYMLFV